ncbi:flagellar basal-body rod protein FlgF [Neorhizobium sp. SOG26]|jgi:flagellar basal-body rod protein FlgF|uniref:Flagellar basal-body rod protein FlgF n=1 Tax=Neorhizobium turbinariae TaxID=2937795 RepID=A0ABT0IQJ6_9HYPH|nr:MULTISPECIES: flagellar basal-body rod protein FlgF [Neorhizobium]AXV14427.1 flagellar basal-body rod protein FlgF [Neorhizobium sp. SOG26]MCK8780150.1 flagellar basal-body rod protein FlgF [Neorhizobium turbinariae]
MQSGLYVGVSSQIALERRLNTIADNMANMNTVGFRATEVKFDEVLSKTRNDLNAKVAFVTQGNDYLSTRTGQLQQTGNPLDFAIKGEAFFAIDTPVGQVLTRDGRFTIDENGQLRSIRGYAVMDAGGAPIQLNRDAGPPTIGADGIILQNGQPVATLGLFTADITKGFIRYENEGVIPVDNPQPVVEGIENSIAQGYVEQSNVNGISEMTQLIQVNRAFESISALMRDSESALNEAIRTLGGSN